MKVETIVILCGITENIDVRLYMYSAYILIYIFYGLIFDLKTVLMSKIKPNIYIYEYVFYTKNIFNTINKCKNEY